MTTIAKTLAQRGTRHGLSYLQQSSVACGIKDVMRSAPNWARLAADQREALEMQAVKIARILSGDPDFHDHWHDIAGYSTLVADRLIGKPRKGKSK